jgi:hypothetical protein
MSEPLSPIGDQYPDDPRGWLVFAHLPRDLQRFEDQRQVADSDRDRSRFTRPATDTERLLLSHLGYDLTAYDTDNELLTHVTYLGPVRRRTWPQLEPTTTPESGDAA